MFLTCEEWRHPNAAVQALARPSTAWQCLALTSQHLSLLAELRHFEGVEHAGSEWMLMARPELLIDCIESGPELLGSVHILVQASSEDGPRWRLETLVLIEDGNMTVTLA